MPERHLHLIGASSVRSIGLGAARLSQEHTQSASLAVRADLGPPGRRDGREVTLKLKPKGKKAKKELVKRGAKAKAKITVTLTDLAGNSTSEKASSS